MAEINNYAYILTSEVSLATKGCCLFLKFRMGTSLDFETGSVPETILPEFEQ
jgi:hypothetical protein